MANALVAYYSRTGNTKKMAEVIAEAIRESGVKVDLIPAQQVDISDMMQYEGIIMGSPTYYGSMAAELKKLIDDSVANHGQFMGKVGGAFTSSAQVGGGNETTVLSILNAMLVHGMVVLGDYQRDHYGPVAVGAPDERALENCRRYGALVAGLIKKLFE